MLQLTILDFQRFSATLRSSTQHATQHGDEVNSLSIETTRRLSVGVLAASGALLFAALNLVGAGVSGGDREFAAQVSRALIPLLGACGMATVCLVWTEIADHPSTPAVGGKHSQANYLQSAFALLIMGAAFPMSWGAVMLVSAARVGTTG